jgi:hypothetical protein
VNFIFSLDLWVIGEGVRICPITGKAFEENVTCCPGGISGDYKNSNWVWDKNTETVKLYAARNEVVAFQLIIERGEQILRGIKVEVTDLVKGESKLEKRHIKIFREWYNYIPKTSPGTFATHILEAGWYAEPLIPSDIDEYGSNFDLPSEHFQTGDRHLGAQQKNQAMWVDIFVPLNQPAGEYTGEIKVSVTSPSLEKRINLKLVVWDFSLPREFHATIELMDGPFAKPYITLAHQHRLTLTKKHTGFEYQGVGEQAKIKWEIVEEKCRQYWTGEAFTEGPGAGVPVWCWRLPFDIKLNRREGPKGGGTWPRVKKGVWPVTQPYPAEYKTTVKALLKDIVERFTKHYPKVKLVIWLNGIDEPRFNHPENGIEYLRELAARIKEYGEMIDEAVGDKILHRIDIGGGFERCAVDLDGDGKISRGETMNAGRKEFSPAQEVINYLKDSVDLWNVGARSTRSRLLHQNGCHFIQIYNAKEARLGAPTINVEGISWRVTGWILWKYQIMAACEWKYSDEQTNPFREVFMGPNNQFPGIWDYLYDASHPPIRAEGKVFPGLRLKAMRRGLQDYEYFWLVTSLKKGDRSFADNLAFSVVKGGADDGKLGGRAEWKHHPRDYFEARKQLAQEILRIIKQ